MSSVKPTICDSTTFYIVHSSVISTVTPNFCLLKTQSIFLSAYISILNKLYMMEVDPHISLQSIQQYMLFLCNRGDLIVCNCVFEDADSEYNGHIFLNSMIT